jgi:transcriptional regulator with XRE-family HTH domain
MRIAGNGLNSLRGHGQRPAEGENAVMSLASHPSSAQDFGDALRVWRRARGMSQLDLALTAETSPRHVSFLETNRARPSRDMVETLADAMVLPRAARNALLLCAGFAPLYPATPLAAEALAPFRAMLAEMMARHAPFPALVVDRWWTVLDANDSARALLGALHNGEGEMNVVRMLTDNPHAGEAIENLAEVRAEMLGRIRLEALQAGADARAQAQIRALEAALAAAPAPKSAMPRSPLVPLVLRSPSGVLKFFSAIAHFGTSEDVTVHDLRLELMFPADDATRRAFGA